MPMEWEEYQNIVTSLNTNISDPETVADSITKLTEDYSNVIKNHNELEKTLQERNEQIDKLTRANTKLTLSVGDSFAPPESVKKQQETDELKNVTLDMILERKLIDG